MNVLKKIAVLTALSVGMGAAGAMAQEVTLRCQHFVSPNNSASKYFFQPWADKIEKESGGRIKVEIYPLMQLGGKPPALYDQIRDGVVDCGWALPAYTPGRFPEAEVFELPFMTTTSAEDSSRAAWEYSQKHLKERFNDIHLIATHVHGPGVVHTKGSPVAKPDDFKQMKLRGPSRQANNLLKSLGATPIGMPVPAFPEALSKGVVDGGVIPWQVVPSLKVHELADSHTQIGGDRSLYNTFFIWGMNKAKYESLPDDLKAIIDANSGVEASAAAGRAMEIGDKDGKEVAEGAGNDIINMDECAVSQLKEISEGLTSTWISEMNAKGLDGAAMVEDAEALVEKYSKKPE